MRIYYATIEPQLAVVHDGNLRRNYPHLQEVSNCLDGLICVHDAAYHSAEFIDCPRSLIANPHDVSETCHRPYMERDDRIFSLQTFKRWKRVDDFIRAIPYLSDFTETAVCGAGIEYCYMTSKTKCKEEYKDELGVPIWENAIRSGMDYRGYVTTLERDRLMQESKLLLDPSWSVAYSKIGCHFNRVMVEAMVQGCIPVCTDLAMKDSRLFKAGVNFVEIPYNADPVDYADALEEALFNPMLATMQENNFELIRQFSPDNIVQQILELADGDAETHGESTEASRAASLKKMGHFE